MSWGRCESVKFHLTLVQSSLLYLSICRYVIYSLLLSERFNHLHFKNKPRTSGKEQGRYQNRLVTLDDLLIHESVPFLTGPSEATDLRV